MLVQFAQHHGFEFHIVIQETGDLRSLYEFYGGSDPARVVLIDREGKIRMVGLGPSVSNSREIGKMLATLLEE